MSELTLICGRCSKPVATGTGFLGVSLGEVRQYQAAVREWRKRNPGDCHDIHDLMAMPEEIVWRSRHYACAPGADDDAYEIAAERIQTWQRLTWWSAHLMGKNWIYATDWDELLEEVASGTSTRIMAAAASAA